MSIFEVLKEAAEKAEAAAKKQLQILEQNGPRYTVHNADLLGNTGPAIGTMLDNCGGAYLTVDGREPLVKQLKKVGKSDAARQSYSGNCWWMSKGVYKGYTLHISYPTGSRRQEMSVHEKAMEAACETLRNYGHNTSVKSYID